jgi:peptide chain release factor 2
MSSDWTLGLAAPIQKELRQLSSFLNSFNKLESDIRDIKDLYDLALQEDDQEVLSGLWSDLEESEKRVMELETQTLFDQEDDYRDAVLEIHAGTGGTEAQWWTEQLLRMYLLWFKRRGFQVELLDTTFGDESGIKSVTVSVAGSLSYGWLRTENGVHRLSRVSEFDASGRRHTSFSSVQVYPFVDETIDIAIQKADLDIETFRATGPGGQHVNTTDSAVRIKHKPTGVVVSCQSERSQKQNKERAMKLLYSKLYNLEIENRRESQKEQHKLKTGISWGHQIRSYILNPYMLIKDHRTGQEIGNVSAVMNGCLDDLVRDYLLSSKTK